MHEAFKSVATPFVLMIQHDLPLMRYFDAFRLLRSMQASPVLQHVHLPTLQNDKNWMWHVDARVPPSALVPLSRIFSWSDRNHVARAAYYRDFVFPRVFAGTKTGFKAGGKTFMEDVLHYQEKHELRDLQKKPRKQNAAHEKYGTYVYGSPLPGKVHRFRQYSADLQLGTHEKTHSALSRELSAAAKVGPLCLRAVA